jgi:LPS-assembly lipoprotein
MTGAVRKSLVALMLCLLAACGFHLRNQSELPSALQPIYIGGAASGGQLAAALRYQLNNSNTSLTGNTAKANYRLMLLNEGHEQRIISLDRRGLAAEYGLISKIEFELYDHNNQRVLGPITLQELRTVTNNPDNALTTSQEILLVQTDIYKALAGQLVRRLGAYANHMPPPSTTAPAASEPPATLPDTPQPSTAPMAPPSAL